MKKTLAIFLAIIFICSALLSSCAQSPQRGEQGLRGIQGEQGVKGEDGKDGKDGEKGEQGEKGSDGKVVTEYLVDSFARVMNLFDKSAATPNSVLNGSTGTVSAMNGFYVSDYIEVEVGKSYSFLTSHEGLGEAMATRLTVYDSNKEYNGYITGTLTSSGTVTVSISTDKVGVTVYRDDIKYVRFTTGSRELDRTMFVLGDTYPNEYYEFGKTYLNQDITLQDSHISQLPPVRSPLAGKKIAYNGDSICESRTDITSSMYNGGAYAQIISDLTGCTFENRGKSGAVLASTTPDGASIRHICNDVENMAADADLICFEGGINDYWNGVPLGEFSESDFTGELDTTTLTGALESTFRQAINKWVGKPICFIIVHKITGTAHQENSAGYTFAEARERMIAVCEKYSIPYYDAYAESGLNPYMPIHNSTYMVNADGCNPNEDGYRKYYVPQLIALFESLIER